MEHFIKGLMNQETQISAIPPERYGDRFVKFISSVTKTREAAEREKQEEATRVETNTHLTGVNETQEDRVSTEKVMERAERDAERSRQRGASEQDVPDRSMHIVRSPSADRGELGTTLPVVEEAVESSSTGGRSARSTESSLQPQQQLSPAQPQPQSRTRPLKESVIRALEPGRDQSHQRPPPTPPKDSGNEGRPPTPPKDAVYENRHSGPPTPPKEERGRGRDKQLPMPPLETFVRVN